MGLEFLLRQEVLVKSIELTARGSRSLLPGIKDGVLTSTIYLFGTVFPGALSTFFQLPGVKTAPRAEETKTKFARSDHPRDRMIQGGRGGVMVRAL